MNKLVECVPNFSEGKRTEIIDAISDAIRNTPGCVLLDVDSGVSTNRTVYTFVGTPDAVLEGALAAAHQAYKLIDMTKQTGEHPRIGTLDVCPFIPVSNVTMLECVELSKQFGKRLADELKVPVYLYAESQENKKRRELPDIRKGEYERLPEKLVDPQWIPDFGSSEFVSKWGATVTGAREFLIAYNVNILSTKEQAHKIALNIREQGRSEKEPGRLKAVRAIGWWLEEANMAQISINLLNFNITNIHQVYEECKKDANEYKLAICGSQIVGLVPLHALLNVADHYMHKEGLMILDEDQKIKLVIERLGLNSINPFNPQERIIEYLMRKHEAKRETFKDMPLEKFVRAVGARTVTPGGGCVAALVASLGTSLTCMCAFLSYGNKKYEKSDTQMRLILPPLYQTYHELMDFIDRDANAFNSYVSAMRMSSSTEEEKLFKRKKMNEALVQCVETPLAVIRKASNIYQHLYKLVPLFNTEAKSDFMVGVKCLEAGIYGAYLNVKTNLKNFDDSMKDVANTCLREAECLAKESQKSTEILLKQLEEQV